MLRSVAKVMVNGNPAGMVVLNANADELEKRLRTVLPTAVAQPVVLNSSGGWIMGGGEKDWLFSAKPDAPDALLSTQEPALWEKIQASSSGQFEYRGNATITLGTNSSGNNGRHRAGW
jgi:urease accessory protein UreH